MSLMQIKVREIEKVFIDHIEAVKASGVWYGLGFYNKSHEDYKLNLLKEAGELYLDKDKNLWYVIKNILHKFSWDSYIIDGGVAIVNIDKKNMRLNFTPYLFERDDLRKTSFIWTLDS